MTTRRAWYDRIEREATRLARLEPDDSALEARARALVSLAQRDGAEPEPGAIVASDVLRAATKLGLEALEQAAGVSAAEPLVSDRWGWERVVADRLTLRDLEVSEHAVSDALAISERDRRSLDALDMRDALAHLRALLDEATRRAREDDAMVQRTAGTAGTAGLEARRVVDYHERRSRLVEDGPRNEAVEQEEGDW